jgi:hypothetical protein
MKRWVATAAMVLGLLGVCMAPAHADPTNAPNVEPLDLTCDGTTYTVAVAPGVGLWTPALVTTSNQVLIPVSYEFTNINLATGEIERASFRKQPANRLPITTCTFREIFTEGGVTFEFSGVVEAMIRPPG